MNSLRYSQRIIEKMASILGMSAGAYAGMAVGVGTGYQMIKKSDNFSLIGFPLATGIIGGGVGAIVGGVVGVAIDVHLFRRGRHPAQIMWRIGYNQMQKWKKK